MNVQALTSGRYPELSRVVRRFRGEIRSQTSTVGRGALLQRLCAALGGMEGVRDVYVVSPETAHPVTTGHVNREGEGSAWTFWPDVDGEAFVGMAWSGAYPLTEPEIQTLQRLADDLPLLVSETSRPDAATWIRTLINAIPEPVFVKTAHGKFVLVNEVMARMYGMSPAEMEGMREVDIPAMREWLPMYQDSDARLLASGTSIEQELEFIDPRTGEVAWKNIFKTTLPWQDGEVCILGLSFNISPLKKLLDERNAVSSRLETLVQMMDLGLWEWDVVGNTITGSPTLWALFGQPDTSALSLEQWYSLVPNADLERIQPVIDGALSGEYDLYRIPYEMMRPDGSTVWVEEFGLVTSRDEYGRATHVTGALLDRTSLREEQRRNQFLLDQLQNLTAGVPGLVYELQQQSGGQIRVSYASKQAVDVLGVSSELLVENVRNFLKLLGNRTEILRYIRAVQVSGETLEPFRFAFTLIRPGQGIRYMTTSAQPVRISEGETRWYGFMEDVTERYILEQEVHQTKELYASVVESQNEFICQYGVDLRFTFVNEAYARRFFKSRAQILGAFLLDVIPPGAQEDALERIRSVSQPGGPKSRVDVLHYTQPDGSSRWEEWTLSALSDEGGHLVGFQAVGRDVTERVQVQEALKVRTEFQRLVLRLATTFVNIPLSHLHEAIDEAIGAVGSFVGVDRAYLFRYYFDEDVMVYEHEWCAEGVPPMIDIARTIQIGQLRELSALHLAGKEVILEDVLALSVDDPVRKVLEAQGVRSIITIPLMVDGSCVGFLGLDAVKSKRSWSEDERALLLVLAQLFANVEQRRRREQALLMARDVAEEATRAKSQFLANMSHEIRTPLNGIIGMASLLHHTSLGTEQQEYVQIIQSSGEHLLSLINDILDFSKVEAGRMEVEEVELNLHEVVGNVGDALAMQAHRKGIALHVLLEPNVPVHVMGDPSKLRQVLLNLVGNAVKFTSHGDVSLSVSVEPGPHGEPELVFSVQDSGIGIPDYRLRDLFTPFMQVDASTTRRYGGTGLGLAISKRIVNLMGGDVFVESTVGEGSTFWFKLPLLPAPDAKPFASSTVLWGKRIVVVDSHESHRKYLLSVLTAWNACVFTLRDGSTLNAEIREAAQEERTPHVLLIEAPDSAEGVRALLKRIYTSPETVRIPTLLMTPLGTKALESSSTYPGFVSVISRPVKLKSLHEALVGLFKHSTTTEDYPPVFTDQHRMFQASTPEILLVEDNLINQKVALAMLKRIGLTATVANNGEEALEVFASKHFDLILLDVQMPGIDGYETAQRIREMEGERNMVRTPVVAMTANAMQEDRQRALDAGMDDYISKPIALDVLTKTVTHYLKSDV